MRLTVDANVVGAFIAGTGPVDHARAVLVGDHEFIAPDLIDAEILSVATKLVRFTGMDERVAREAARHARRLPVTRVPVARYADRAFDLSVALGHSSYDCVYLAVAITERAPLVTADRRLHRIAAQAGLAEHVRWVGDSLG